MTLTFKVPDMTCGHCVRVITESVKQVAPHAQVQADVATHRVSVGGAGDSAQIQAAIQAAGYSPEPTSEA